MSGEAERALEGWSEIAKMFPFSERKLRGMRQELLDCGAIFKVRKGHARTIIVCAFPSMIRRYISLKASRGYIL